MYDFKIAAGDSATLYRDLASALEGLTAGEPDTIANMANADPHAIAGNSMIRHTHQHVANIAHPIVKTKNDRSHPLLVRNWPNVLSAQ